jgi:hypothetical protein
MDAGDAVEARARTLEEVAETAADPNVRAAAAAGMSRTYSESLGVLGRAAGEAAQAARARKAEALVAAGKAGRGLGDPEALAEAFGPGATRGAFATELYTGALLCLALRGAPGEREAALAQLELAKDRVFGLGADSLAAAAADTRALAEYHPTQAMCYTPLAWEEDAPAKGLPGDTEPPETSEYSEPEPLPPALDLALPRARVAVRYDLAPLLDRRRAVAFGPVAPVTAGLSYRLVERLRTIRADPIPAAAGPPGTPGVRGVVEAPGVLRVTTDRGRTTSVVSGPAGEWWAPFAGARPRVEQYAAASVAVILQGVRAERAAGWTETIREEFEAGVRAGTVPAGDCGEDAIIGALAEEFGKAYDRAPPDSPGEFLALVIGDGPGPGGAGGYVSAAVARVGFGMLRARLAATLAAPTARVPYAVLEREMCTTQAVAAMAASQKVWRRLRAAFRPADAETCALAPDRKRPSLIALFRRIATDALADTTVACVPPSLKLFAASPAGRPA